MTSQQSQAASTDFWNQGINIRNRWGAPRSDDGLSTASEESSREYSLLAKCLAEFVGVFTFVFVGTSQAYVTQFAADNILHAAFAHGLTIFILVTSLGHISGGHFNPAVSWAITIVGKLSPVNLPFYVASQIIGGICGAFMTAALNEYGTAKHSTDSVDPSFMDENGTNYRIKSPAGFNRTVKAIMTEPEYTKTYAGATLLNVDNYWWQGLLSETVVSYFLVHTILITAVDTNKNLLAPLAIGMTLTIDILAVGKITGASMNPARSFGPNVAGSLCVPNISSILWKNHYIYWIGPFLGASIAALWFRLFESRGQRFIR